MFQVIIIFYFFLNELIQGETVFISSGAGMLKNIFEILIDELTAKYGNIGGVGS